LRNEKKIKNTARSMDLYVLDAKLYTGFYVQLW
jgi:hypothetical protein